MVDSKDVRTAGQGGASNIEFIGWFLVGVILIILIAGILSFVSSDRRQWVNAIEEVDGVESVHVENEGVGFIGYDIYVAEIAVSPDLTEEQALAVVGASCDYDPNMTSVTVSTSWSSGPPPWVEYPAPEVFSPQSCLIGARVVQYSHTFDEASDTSPS